MFSREKTIKKILSKIFYALVALFAIDAALVFGIPSIKRDIPHADAAIVLGAAINTPTLNNRTLTALDLYKQGKTDTLILTGGKGYNRAMSEAGYMQKIIKQNTETLPTIYLDENSTNTQENIYNAKKLYPDAKSVIIVSDEFHLARGVILALRAGYWPIYWSAPDSSYYTNKNELRWYYARELAAIVAYIPHFITGK